MPGGIEMDHHKQSPNDIIDKDLYEEFDEEVLLELVEQARIDALRKEAERKAREEEPKPRYPKWAFWLIAFALLFNIVALLPQTFSVPAVEFLVTSAKLSTKDEIKTYKEAVVVIETENTKGTGFAFNADGDIITNYHVIEGNDTVTVAFPKHGLFVGEVTETFPDVDLAIVTLTEQQEEMPYLHLAKNFTLTEGEHIYFIGNPLKFQGIANEGTIMDYVHVSSKELPVVMIDAPVYRGNSGSPVIDEGGKVIGVVFATLDHDTEGRVGLFIPIDYLHERYNSK